MKVFTAHYNYEKITLGFGEEWQGVERETRIGILMEILHLTEEAINKIRFTEGL